MRYNVGDKVLVREDLKCGKVYTGVAFYDSMIKFCGKVLTIRGKYGGTPNNEPCYIVEENPYDWSDDMFSRSISGSNNKVTRENKEMKYKIGDRVKVRNDLVRGIRYSDMYFTESMEKYRGKVLTITNNNTLFSGRTPCYDVAECYCLWTDEMFEEFIENKVEEIVMKYNVGDKVRVREDLEIGQMFDNEHMFTKSMSEYRGKTVTIVSFNEDSYTIEEAFSIWTDEMFEGLAEGAEKKENKMKYKPGDKVRVRNDLEFDKEYGDWNFTSGMVRMRGKIVTIGSVHRDYYLIKEDEDFWSWTDEMFEGIAEDDSWEIIINGNGNHITAELYTKNESMRTMVEASRYFLDKTDVEAATKAIIEDLFKPAPKFQEDDIVSRACGYYRVVGVPIYDNKCNSFVYDLAMTPGNKTLTSEPIRENELTLVSRPKIEGVGRNLAAELHGFSGR